MVVKKSQSYEKRNCGNDGDSKSLSPCSELLLEVYFLLVGVLYRNGAFEDELFMTTSCRILRR